MSATQQSTSEQAFQKALECENRGEASKAEQWLKLAVKREQDEKPASAEPTS